MEGLSDQKRMRMTHTGDSGSSCAMDRPVICTELHMERDAKREFYAKTALLVYNKRMGTKYAFERMVDHSTKDGYTHMNFMGKCPLKLFFAEISLEDDLVTTCTIVEHDNPLFRVGCGICHPYGLIYHPHHVYLGGHFQYTGSRTVHPYLKQLKSEFENLYEGSCEEKKLDDNDLRELKEKAIVFVKRGLDIYNGQHYYADYEFSELTGVVSFVDETEWKFGHWLHGNFKATNKNPESDPVTELFFIEIRLLDDHFDASIGICCILKSEKTVAENQSACGVCKSLRHPTCGFSAGTWGTVLTAWEPSCSLALTRKFEWRLRVRGSMDTDNRRGELVAAESIAPSLQECGKIDYVGKGTGDCTTLECGIDVASSSQDKQHQIVKCQLIEEVTFPIANCQDEQQQIVSILKQLQMLSEHYGAFYYDKERQMSYKEISLRTKRFNEVEKLMLDGVGFEGQAGSDVNNTCVEAWKFCGALLRDAYAMVERFERDLAGLTHAGGIQKVQSLLDCIYSNGVQMITKMCLRAMSRLLMLGKSLEYNAKDIEGDRQIGSDIDKDILHIIWPVDRIEKVNIIRHHVEIMYAYLGLVFDSAYSGLKRVARISCMVYSHQKAIVGKVGQYLNDLSANKMMATQRIFSACEFLSDLLCYISLTTDDF